MADENRAEWYRELKAEADRIVADIDAGYRFQSGMGNGPMKDVTAELRAQQVAVSQNMEKIARDVEASAAGRPS